MLELFLMNRDFTESLPLHHSIWGDLSAERSHKGPQLDLWTPLVFFLNLILPY